MKTVLIIGAGQLGSRHLQGLSACDQPLAIHLLDPSPQSLARAQARFAEMAGATMRHRLHEAASVAQLPRQIDLAISATTANTRLASLRAVLDHATITDLVLEKVLFQRLADYDAAQALLANCGSRAWVNCPRRLFPGYIALRNFFGHERPALMQVSGANWGLGCNGIHFTDLFQYLSGDSNLQYETTLLDASTHDSKRPGYHEFSGTLVGRSAASMVELQCSLQGSDRHLILLRSANQAALVDEVGATVKLLDAQGHWSECTFEVPYQSQLTGRVASDLLAGRPIALTPYEVSAKLHRAVLAPLLAHFNALHGTQYDACPVT